jgi:hypothetical protein
MSNRSDSRSPRYACAARSPWKRRSAISAQIASNTPNGQVPARKPYAPERAQPHANVAVMAALERVHEHHEGHCGLRTLPACPRGYPGRMAETAAERAFSCTLDGPAFRLREDEFRGLFARALRVAEPIDERCARLVLDRSAEAEVRDVLTREQSCCSFFGFAVEAAGDSLSVTVRVPEGSEAALAFLLGLTAA